MTVSGSAIETITILGIPSGITPSERGRGEGRGGEGGEVREGGCV